MEKTKIHAPISIVRIFHKIVTILMGLITGSISCMWLHRFIFTSFRPHWRSAIIPYALLLLYFSIGLILNKRRHILYSLCFCITVFPVILEQRYLFLSILGVGYILVQLVYIYNEYKSLPIIKRICLILTICMSFGGLYFWFGFIYKWEGSFIIEMFSFIIAWTYLSALIIFPGFLEKEGNIFMKILLLLFLFSILIIIRCIV